MAEVVLFHHVQGLTDGVRAFAEQLRAGGHTVHAPDLFDGEVAATVEDGIAPTRRIGDQTLDERVAGSWGAATAQRLAQARPSARGALLCEACIPLTGDWAFGPWPDGVPVQVHGMDQDPFFALEGDIDAARERSRELLDRVG
jgi:hypothetical protein